MTTGLSKAVVFYELTRSFLIKFAFSRYGKFKKIFWNNFINFSKIIPLNQV
jgi:hypothetical protein